MTNQDLESCKRDIEIIKSTIEKSKVNLGSMALLFLIYGVTILISNTLCPPVTMYLDIIQSFYPWLRYIVLAALFAVYCMLLHKTRANNNVYTLRLLHIWGITMFGIPLITLAKNLIILILGNDILNRVQPVILVLVHLLEILAFIFALLFTGVVLGNKIMVILSLLLMPTTFWILMSHAGGVALVDGVYIASYIASQLQVCYNLVAIIYIGLGVLFSLEKIRQKRKQTSRSAWN